MVERDREHLIRPARRIVALLAVDDVVEIAALGVPEAALNESARAVGVRRQIDVGRRRRARRSQSSQQAAARCTRAR